MSRRDAYAEGCDTHRLQPAVSPVQDGMPPAAWDGWYRTMFDASPVAIALADEHGLLVLANEGYCAILGRPLDELVGRSSAEFTHADDLAQHAAMEQLMSAAAAQGRTLRVEKRYVQPDGSVHWGWVSVAPVTGPAGEVWTMAVILDTTERRRVETELHVEASTDALTGLLNRRGWWNHLDRLTDRWDQTTPVTVALLDLDRFKDYNDAHGHPTGDVLLQAFSAALMSEARDGDLVARWGGEEFVLALPGCNADDAARVLAQLAELVPDGQTFSAGHTLLRPAETVQQCLVRIDRYLYEAKRAGRNRVFTDG